MSFVYLSGFPEGTGRDGVGGELFVLGAGGVGGPAFVSALIGLILGSGFSTTVVVGAIVVVEVDDTARASHSAIKCLKA